ncbi:hypothetical protein [Pseudoalteromonas umbrosa]|uniref:hypothetical protein n=1 Tax=Pseudoalteromonas umbrosa TaxID=3048489 RepID=UPI0024C35712|nr:hypothetical protein [Pseudoalteromonas sp. B95]MDK1288490.1 hypothetical protein [Pseudoalteromonas sp. B95]
MIELNNQQYDQFVWTDEFNYQSVAEQTERALNGAQHIEKTTIPVGRAITLWSQQESYDVFKALFDFAQSQLSAFQITIRGAIHTVVWDHTQQPVTGTEIKQYSDAPPDAFENVTLKFKTV